MKVIRINRADVPIVNQQFSRKKKWSVYFRNSVSIPLNAGMWDSGSKDDFASYYIGTLQQTPKQPKPGQFMGAMRDQEEFGIKPGSFVIRTGVFMGKESAPTLYIHPDDADKFNTYEETW